MTQTVPEATNAPEEAVSALDLRPDGRIVIDFGENEVTLRRPTLGEFRRWRTKLSEINDLTIRIRLRHRTEIEEEIAAGDAMPEEEKLARRAARTAEVDDVGEREATAWWAEVFSALAAGDGVPDSQEWPPFLVFGEDVLPDVLNHWRAVPLAPGTRSNRSH